MTTTIEPQNADHYPKFALWDAERGGILLWRSCDLSSAGRTWCTPAKTADGADTPKPHYAACDPTLMRLADMTFYKQELVSTHAIRTRIGSQGFSIKVSDTSTSAMNKRVTRLNDAEEKRNGTRPYCWMPTGDMFGPPTAVILRETPCSADDAARMHAPAAQTT